MSTLQFVILLVVIFLSTNGPVNLMGYVRKTRNWLHMRRARQAHVVLRSYGFLFRSSAFNDFSGFCLDEDFINQRNPDPKLLTRVTPTFIFPIHNQKRREALNDEALKIIGTFLYRLCDRRVPRKYFDKKYLDLNMIMRNEKNLLIPQDTVNERESLERLAGRLAKYLSDRGK